jgi:hypothetical protein
MPFLCPPTFALQKKIGHLQAALRYALHETWRGFLIFVRGEDSGYIPDG